MTITCITQARLTSTRLPSKILLPITDHHNAVTLLSTRVSKSALIDHHLFAIPDTNENEPLASYLESNQIPYIAGSENDLVDRHLLACSNDTRTIVRITSDCPLVDPFWIDKAIELYLTGYEYVSTYTPAATSKFCNGSDIEVFSVDLLKTISHDFLDASDREHVTFPLWDGRVNCNYTNLNHLIPEPITDVRITLDYEEDLTVMKHLSKNIDLVKADLLSIAKMYRQLNLGSINGDIRYDAGW